MGCGNSKSVQTTQSSSDVTMREHTPNGRKPESAQSRNQEMKQRSRTGGDNGINMNGNVTVNHDVESEKSLKEDQEPLAVPVVIKKNVLTPEEEERLLNEFKEHLMKIIDTLNEEIDYYGHTEWPEEVAGWTSDSIIGGRWMSESWGTDYMERCKERIKTCEYFHGRGRLRTEYIQPGDDPNKCTFPLCPDWLKPDDLRWFYTEDYIQFDTNLEGSAWISFEVDTVKACGPEEIHSCFVEQQRPWINEWELFDMDIDGEAGWDVIELDLFKNDVLTDEQQSVLDARAHRNDLDDKDRMTRRRKALARHFTKKYEKEDDAILEAVGTWANTITAGEQHFLELCDV